MKLDQKTVDNHASAIRKDIIKVVVSRKNTIETVAATIAALADVLIITCAGASEGNEAQTHIMVQTAVFSAQRRFNQSQERKAKK